MLNKEQKQLSPDIYLKCFVCNEHEASHICMYELSSFNVKLCMCPQCAMLSKQRPATDLLQKVA
jgi:hypothetical protein